MPPRGVKPGTKRARQYEHIKESQRERGASTGRAEEIAARTVNKERARSGQSRCGASGRTGGFSTERGSTPERVPAAERSGRSNRQACARRGAQGARARGDRSPT